MKINKNQTLSNETARLFDFIESTLIPANQHYIDTELVALVKLKEDFELEKAAAQIEIEREETKSASKGEANEYSYMDRIEHYYGYEETELYAYYNQVRVHSSMYVVVLVQSHIEAMLMLLLKQNLNADEFKHVSEIKNEVIYECLRALKLQAILSDKRYQTICDYKDIRNDYIHDQYNLKPKKKKNNKKYKEDKEDKETYYPSLIKPLPKEELEKYLVCARWLLLKAYEEAKKIN